MPNESVGLKGVVRIEVLDKNGNVKDKREIKNLIVNTGKAQIASLMGGLSTAAFKYIAIGTDDGTTLALGSSNTALGNEIARKAASVTQVTTTVTNDTLQLQAMFSSADGLTGTAAITESGVFNASTGGTMLNRTTFAPVNVNWDNGDSIQITWKIQVQ